MKKTAFFLLLILFFSACSGSDDTYENNPNLPNIRFNARLNLNLPEYSDLRFAGNSYSTQLYGVKGIVIYNINGSQFAVFELSDPNHPAVECAAMTVDGVIAGCNCDGNTYNIITGEQSTGVGVYTMKPYRWRLSGGVLEVWN